MTRLLVSVRSQQEAAIAVDAGVHVIDVKEPSRGPLGRADHDTVCQVLRTVSGRVPVSAACGELRDVNSVDAARLSELAFVKFGLSQIRSMRNWQAEWHAVCAAFPPSVAHVAVAYADMELAQSPPVEAVIEAGHAIGCRYLLIDTFDKRAGTLLEHLSVSRLGAIVQAARRSEMRVALAGSLNHAAIRQLSSLRHDFVAVRGAACQDGRQGQICVAKIRSLVHALSTPDAGERATIREPFHRFPVDC